MTRIENYIKQLNIVEENIHNSEYDINGEYAIKIVNGNFSWGIKQHEGNEKNSKKNNNKSDEKSKNEKIMHRETIDKLEKLSEPLVIKSERETTNEENIEKEELEFMKDGCKIQIPIPEGVEYDVALKNINLIVKPGEILGIIGEVGSGKSSLLQAILNCLILLNPKECDGIYIKGKLGYSSQTSWIQNETIKNNILFFKNYDRNKYEEVLEKCQLKYDLDILE